MFSFAKKKKKSIDIYESPKKVSSAKAELRLQKIRMLAGKERPLHEVTARFYAQQIAFPTRSSFESLQLIIGLV